MTSARRTHNLPLGGLRSAGTRHCGGTYQEPTGLPSKLPADITPGPSARTDTRPKEDWWRGRLPIGCGGDDIGDGCHFAGLAQSQFPNKKSMSWGSKSTTIERCHAIHELITTTEQLPPTRHLSGRGGQLTCLPVLKTGDALRSTSQLVFAISM